MQCRIGDATLVDSSKMLEKHLGTDKNISLTNESLHRS
jgi:hypothetical protein